MRKKLLNIDDVPMTQEKYVQYLNSYSTLMVGRNLSTFIRNTMNGNDFVAMAFEKGFKTYDQAVTIIRGDVITEKRRLLADLQHRGKLNHRHVNKTCKCCKEPKPLDEYYPALDARTGFAYYFSKCKECVLATKSTESYKAKRRELYANDDRAKQLARVRYERFKNKNILCKTQ
jgi:hypothetical protein